MMKISSRVALTACVLLSAVAMGGCRNRITSSITINGAGYSPTSCRSGQALGFMGVEFTDGAGSRLRLVSDPMGSGQAIVYYFPMSGAAPGGFLGQCGPFSIHTQNSTINNIRNVEGNATLTCSNGLTTVGGTVSFSNCH